jgi:hypothetical protein
MLVYRILTFLSMSWAASMLNASPMNLKRQGGVIHKGIAKYTDFVGTTAWWVQVHSRGAVQVQTPTDCNLPSPFSQWLYRYRYSY